jgi:hypothetical protein
MPLEELSFYCQAAIAAAEWLEPSNAADAACAGWDYFGLLSGPTTAATNVTLFDGFSGCRDSSMIVRQQQ